MTTCIARVGNSVPAARLRITTRTWACWSKPARDASALFAQRAGEVVVANRRCLSREIQPYWRDYYGASWLLYFKAWKGNFGYGSVPDNFTPTSGAIYTANVQWCFDMRTLNTFIPAGAPEPPGCWCQIQGCPFCEQIYNPA